MNINYETYNAVQILSTYEFVYTQWLGGRLTCDTVNLTLEIFENNMVELKENYLAKENSNIKTLKAIEEKAMSGLTTILNIPEDEIKELFDKKLCQINKITRDIIINS